MTGSPDSGGSRAGAASRDRIRDLDRRAIEEYGIPGIVLMENAARGSADALGEVLAARPGSCPPPYRIICGRGANGGDGFALARHLHNRGQAVSIHLAEPRSRTRPDSDAGINLRIVLRMGLDLREPAAGRIHEVETARDGTVIDAMLGTGLDRPLEPPYLDWVEAINRSGRPVIAIDIPSGLHADTGQVLGAAIRAAHTFTMAVPKLGFFRGEGPRHAGIIHIVDIGIPRALISATDQKI
jgi:NAD(P)H-hydrate epimerase